MRTTNFMATACRSKGDGPGNEARPPAHAAETPDVVFGLARRLRLPVLERHHGATTIMGLFTLVNGVVSIGLMTLAALVTGAPFIFPSLGPTAMMLFSTPLAASASPRNTIVGHFIGVVCGYLALVVFGLTQQGPELQAGVTLAGVGAAALSLGLTGAVLVWLRVPHPPAGATTLIISLGILREPWQLVVLMLAVVLLVGQGLIINRLAGLPYPWWAPSRCTETIS